LPATARQSSRRPQACRQNLRIADRGGSSSGREILVKPARSRTPLTASVGNLVLDQVLAPLVVKARRKPIDQSIAPIRRAQKQSTASELNNPPSNAASTARLHRSKSKCSALHLVGIGPSSIAKVAVSTTTSLIRAPMRLIV